MKFSFEKSLLDKHAIEETSRSLESYRAHLAQVLSQGGYGAQESSINLPFDQKYLDESKSLIKEKVSSQLKYIIVVGIGGSNLGTKALYDALFGYVDDLVPDRYPKMIFADTVEAEFFAALKNFLETQVSNVDEVLVQVISKSGGTTETIANAEFIMDILRSRFPNALERMVVTTDEGSKLWKLAEKEGWSRLSIPATVGGRYSVFSAVGIFPLLALGIDGDALLEGASAMAKKCVQETGLHNPALVSATTLFLQKNDGATINDNFFFHPELESIGKWYRQLMGESIGKQHDVEGKEVNTGITPTVSIGSTDLHSMGQLYLGGPKDKYTTFVSASTDKVSTPEHQIFPGLVSGITGKSFNEIMKAILSGVKIAYEKRGLPYMEIELEGINERELGALLQFKMIEMMYLGRLMNVNPFDQPNVEMYKVETKRILS